MVQSGPFTGMKGGKDSDGMKAVTALAGRPRDQGRFSINFRLRDWLISRQRYWGNPIPAIHCDACGLVPVPESDLPVVLPMDVDITKGETLADHPEFYEVACPACGAAARRETDTMDTFTCSSWYYIRFSDARNDARDLGQGQGRLLDAGRSVHRRHRARHPAPAVLALLHEGVPATWASREFDEPFTNLLTQGMVRMDGEVMSKSKGNVVAPEDMIAEHGADALRAYILFMAPPDKDLEWSYEGVDGMDRWLRRVWRLVVGHSRGERRWLWRRGSW